MWGQVITSQQTASEIRIIPTRVGTRLSKHTPKPLTRDHPHACGDKTTLTKQILFTGGSSPRVWGQGREDVKDCSYCGIIPTRVGTRLKMCVGARLTRDHPHACGDKCRTLCCLTIKVRIIPTRVGTSTYPFCYLKVHKDHPHACGDKYPLSQIRP